MNAATFSGLPWAKSLRTITPPMDITAPSWPLRAAAWLNSSVTSRAMRNWSFCMSTLVTLGSGNMAMSTSPAAARVASSACSALYSTVTLSVRP